MEAQGDRLTEEDWIRGQLGKQAIFQGTQEQAAAMPEPSKPSAENTEGFTQLAPSSN